MTVITWSEHLLFILAAVCFGVSFFYTYFQIRKKGSYSQTLLYFSLLFGFVLQSLALNIRAYTVQGCPLGNTFEIIQFILWCTVLLFLILRPIFKIKTLGLFTALSASLFSSISLLNPSWDAPYSQNQESSHSLIELHASMAIFSYALYMLLAIISGMRLLQEYGLKNLRFQGLFRSLPPIQKLDRIAHSLLWIGTLTLFVAIIFVLFYWSEHPDSVSLIKLIATVLISVAYLSVGLLKHFNYISSQRQAVLALILFLFALLTLGTLQGDSNEPDRQGSSELSPPVDS